MTLTVEAIYENGVLKPTQPLPLKEHDRVEVTVQVKQSIARETAGMLGWTGTHEELEQILAEAEEFEDLP